ncbi:MAG TPA: hypothetical protein VFA90_14040 [Terriglobales bacterium]|nr:hypothetical protein [Terriglobales bacterium]
MSDSDGRNGILSNAVDIAVNRGTIRGMLGKYVFVSGLYHAPAPQADFNGYIDHILDVKALSVGDTSK